MSILSELLVRIGVDDAGVTKGLSGAESKVSKFASGIGSKLKVAGAVAGAAGGAAIASGFAKSLDTEVAQQKLKAQLGNTGPLAAQAGKVAGNLYANAYGENLGEVNDAVRSVIQSGALMGDTSSASLEKITGSAIYLSQIMGTDVSETMNAVSQMVRTGLAPNAAAAMDILAKGFQSGNDKAGDLLDTFNEYGTQFRKLGLDGQTAMGIISQGLKGGARDADLVADAIKEFSIRAVDGSKTTASGFQMIGLSAQDMTAKIAAGGPTAAAALDVTIGRLRGMKDPALQAQAATALFGTQAEDLGQALFAINPATAVAGMGQFKGTMDQVNQAMDDTAKNKITAMQRSWDQWTMSLVAANGPLGTASAGVMAFGASGLDMAGNVGMVTLALGPFSGKILGLAGDVAMSTGKMLLSGASWAAGMMARALVVAASWIVAMGPIGWAIAAVIGLVALIILNWDKVKGATVAAFSAVGNAISGAINWVLGLFSGIGGRIGAVFSNAGSWLVNAGRAIVTGLWNGVAALGSWLESKIIGFVKSFVPGPVLQYLGIASPSKLFAQIGMQTGAGLAQGITGSAGLVSKAAANLATTTATDFTTSVTGPSIPTPRGVNAAGNSGGPTITLTSDGSQLGKALLELISKAARGQGLQVVGAR